MLPKIDRSCSTLLKTAQARPQNSTRLLDALWSRHSCPPGPHETPPKGPPHGACGSAAPLARARRATVGARLARPCPRH
eukprot:15457358-Alexandrium_andersonii.AAC.1